MCKKDAAGRISESSLSQSCFSTLKVKLWDLMQNFFLFFLACVPLSKFLSQLTPIKSDFYLELNSTVIYWCTVVLYPTLQFPVKELPFSMMVTLYSICMKMWLHVWGKKTTSSLVCPLKCHPLNHSPDSNLFCTKRFKGLFLPWLIWIYKCIKILLSLKQTFLRTLIFDVKDTSISQSATGLSLSQLQDIDVWLLKLYLKLNSSLRGILIINSFREEVSFTDTNILYSHALCQYIHRENFRVLSPHFSFLYSCLWFDYLIHHFFWQELLSCTWLGFIALPKFPQAKHVYITAQICL